MTGQGTGTDEFSQMKAGDTIPVLGPLGNGFPVEKAEGKKVFLMGGGIGVPPIIAGYRDCHTFLREEFEAAGTLYIATEDGSVGTKGNVMDAIRENALEADVIYACGPTPMLRAIKKYAEENGIECYISLEERMACGIGGGFIMDMKVNIAGVEWKNPVTVASGTFGSGAEFADYVDINKLGAVTTKGVANVPWAGNPTPRVAEVYGGMMNAIGLQNPGIDLFCERERSLSMYVVMHRKNIWQW